ncbi:mismatch-specific DNA-glycosylase [Bradyrhizobium sp. SEMIA]|uniref:mismatch-specific DNA-glycosylase n=1 Tax=Bradyrhizobium sp. SEMIA TaxID=2597515 RepID=UPI0018A36D24|nr:mismatch-specific DNA-glycosylase [Bradyrhizobium sp. SEMIA]
MVHTTSETTDVLPDLLGPNLTVVFCGTAPGRTSARQGAYYAHKRNRFWSILHECGFTDHKLEASEYGRLKRFGIGLTDLCKRVSGNDDELPKSAFSPERLLEALSTHKPRYLAFTSRTAGRVICGSSAQYGRQRAHQATDIFILPTTSSRWGERWWSEQKRHWLDLRRRCEPRPPPGQETHRLHDRWSRTIALGLSDWRKV